MKSRAQASKLSEVQLLLLRATVYTLGRFRITFTAPPWSGCLVGIRNDRTGLKHCFLGERGEFVVASAFNS